MRSRLRDRARIASFLRRDTHLHLYGLGDLDEPYWTRTEWHGWMDGDEVRALALMYSGLSVPTLLALCSEDGERTALEALLLDLSPELPDSFYLHLTPGLAPALEGSFKLTPRGTHLKMSLRDPAKLEGSVEGAVPLTPADAEEALRFYDECYPGHWFEPHILESGKYFGIRLGGELACVAGVHVYSPAQRAAALGNIATRASRRGKGLAAAATRAVCRSLLKDVDHIGLNVKADNWAAVACYRKLGFETAARYEEHDVDRSPGDSRPDEVS